MPSGSTYMNRISVIPKTAGDKTSLPSKKDSKNDGCADELRDLVLRRTQRGSHQ